MTKNSTLPVPVKYDSRNCFGIAYFTHPDAANIYAADVVRRGLTYNGGWFDGKPCGREPNKDYVDPELGQLYAVTD